MATFKGTINAKHMQVIENPQGPVLMKIGVKPEELTKLIQSITEIMDQERIQNAELEQILEDADRGDSKSVISRLELFVQHTKRALETGASLSSGTASIVEIIRSYL